MTPRAGRDRGREEGVDKSNKGGGGRVVGGEDTAVTGKGTKEQGKVAKWGGLWGKILFSGGDTRGTRRICHKEEDEKHTVPRKAGEREEKEVKAGKRR